MTPLVPLGPVARLLQLGVDALRGELPSAGEVARSLVGIGLDLVPEDELRGYLTAEARLRADLAADAATAKKFGGT